MGGESMALKSMIGWMKGERGNVALLFALMLPMVIGGAALGVETTYWYLTRLQMQSAADAAAYAGAMEKRAGGSISAVQTVSKKAALDNGYSDATGTIAINTPPTSGSGGNRSVEVIINAKAERFFTAFFTKTDVTVKARAVAKYTPAGNACVLALSYTASRAAEFGGNGTTTFTACSVMSNSTASDALYTGGSTILNTECLISVGGISTGGTVNKTCDESILEAPPVADPFANYVWPTNTGGTYSQAFNSPNGLVSLSPGRYTRSQGVDLKSDNVKLSPGNYFFDGDLTIGAGANVSCTCNYAAGEGVTIFLGPNSKLTINGTATVNLRAPAQPNNAQNQLVTGMLFVADPTNTQSHTINGTASSSLTGDIYFKKATVNVLGNFSGDGGCMHIVADQVKWSGSSTVSANCSGYGMIEIPGIYTVRLIE
jgi:Flp pilus assembly protein TadG